MSTLCPNCQNNIPEGSAHCPDCSRLENGPIDVSSRENGHESAAIDQVVLEIDLHIESAWQSVEQEDFQAAVRFLNRAIIDAPDDRVAECSSLRGYVYLKLRDFKRAEADCSEAISRYWQDAETYAWRAAARGEQDNWPSAFDDLAKAIDIAGDKKDQYLQLMEDHIETASEYYRQQIVSGNDSADLFYDRGWVYFRAGRKSKAERDFQHALEKQPEHGNAGLGMAGLRLESGKAEEALSLSELVISSGDSDLLREALLIRTRANQILGNTRQVTKDLNQLKTLAASDVQWLLEIGKLRLSLGDNTRTVSDMTALLKKAPEMREALLIRGDAYQAIQNFKLAIKDYSKYLRYAPDSLSARLHRGNAYLEINELDRAIKDFDRSLEIDPVCSQAFLGRSRVYVAKNQLDQALTQCEKASRLDNQQADVFGTMAEIYYQLCDYSRAIEEFVRAERLSTTQSRKSHYCYRRGNAYYQLNQLENSLRYFRKSTRLDPNHAGAWIWQAQVCAKLEKWSKAILGLEQAIRSRPVATESYRELGKPVAEKAIKHFSRMEQRGSDSKDLYRSRGLAHQFLGNHEQALLDFTRSLELDEDAEVRLRRGRCLVKLMEFDRGLADLKRLIDEDPENHVARYWRADAYSRLGEEDRAISDIVKAIKRQASDPRYFLLHAELMFAKREWAKAIRSLEQAIRYDPLDPTLFQRRGMTYFEMGKNGRAVSDFTRCLQLSSNLTELLVHRGRAYAALGKFDLAMQDFETALGHDKQFLDAYCGRGAVMAAAGDSELALIWLTKALHRFSEPRELALILFQRGKIFFEMGRATRAINDYCLAIDRCRDDRSLVARIRLARSAALAHQDKWEESASDLKRILKRNPDDQELRLAIQWINSDRSEKRPGLLPLPGKSIRPLRPPQVSQPIEIELNPELDTQPPFDMWLVRVADRKEYGPVTLETLSRWVGEGRLGVNSQVLRSDWSQWKRVEKLFPELATQDFVESFPELHTQSQPVDE